MLELRSLVQEENVEAIGNFQLGRVLGELNALLVLDDLDRLMESDEAGLTELLEILQSCRRLKLVTTSRLDLPFGMTYQPWEVLTVERAMVRQMFRQYAPRESDWGLESGSDEVFEKLIDFFDGYPLPIKVAASYMKQRRCSLTSLYERLESEPCRTLQPPTRQGNRSNSLEASLNLSYQVLPPGAKEMFPLLALFPGGLTEELTQFVFGEEKIESLETLLQFSMAERQGVDEPWRLPEPARRYAEEKQSTNGLSEYRQRTLDYYYQLAQKIETALAEKKISVDEVRQGLRSEQANLKHFLLWSYEAEVSQDRICRSARITASLLEFWQILIPGEDIALRCESALEVACRNKEDLGEAELHDKIGLFQRNRGESDLAKASLKNATALFESLEELVKSARAKVELAKLYELDKRLETAQEWLEAALKDYQAQDYEPGIVEVERLIQRVKFLRSLVEDRLVSFQFETVTVNKSGELIRRETLSARSFTIQIAPGVDLEMVAIPGGEFWMGSPEGEGFDREKPQHRVTVQSFFMGKYPVTQAQWRAVAALPQVKRSLNHNPSRFKGDNLPVEKVSWFDAVEFCDRLSRHTGIDYRLPTEAEWEYACRAGTTTPFHFGETLTSALANYNPNYIYAEEPKGEYRDKTTPVGSFPPNAFGLYDMHGNVWEWCLDPWHKNYDGAPTDGSAWLDNSDKKRYVIRGGSWYVIPYVCRCAYRNNYNPNAGDFNIGFRVICVAPRTS